MKTILIVCVSFVLAVICGCDKCVSGFPINISTVQKIDSGSFGYEERQGKIIVAVTDKYGDCHMHILNYDGMLKADAIAILESKKQAYKEFL